MVDPAIAVNLLWCVPGDVGGSEEYLVRQLLGLAEAEPRFRVTLYVVEGFAETHRDLTRLFPTVVAPFDGASRARRIAGETTWFRKQTSSAVLRHHGGAADVRHPPCAARFTTCNTDHPEILAQPRMYLAATIGMSVRRARVVTVPSDYVRGSVVEAYGADPSKVRVVPHGFEPELLRDITAEDELRARFSLGDGRVIVYPAVTNRHKNHKFLIRLLDSHWRDPDLRLVFIGGSGPPRKKCNEPATRGSESWAVSRRQIATVSSAWPRQWCSRVSTRDSAPLIEAMALGCPVIASDSTCIPAILDGAGLVLPLAVDLWSDALERAERDRARMIAAGLRRATAFTARASGEALAEAYTAALEGT
jgi:alpha-1,3-rhamnosyl/mannosyltransferase